MAEDKKQGPTFEQMAVAVLAVRLIEDEGISPDKVVEVVEAEFAENVERAGKGGE